MLSVNYFLQKHANAENEADGETNRQVHTYIHTQGCKHARAHTHTETHTLMYINAFTPLMMEVEVGVSEGRNDEANEKDDDWFPE